MDIDCLLLRPSSEINLVLYTTICVICISISKVAMACSLVLKDTGNKKVSHDMNSFSDIFFGDLINQYT